MECHTTIRNLKINKNKSIGEVIVVVEGESEEFRLLRYIFTNVLDYNYIPIKRNKVVRDIYRSKSNSNSTIIVVNTSSSNIGSLMSDDDYKEKFYQLLSSNYKKNLKNVPIYILWDRDNCSNMSNVVIDALNIFRNSMDNDYDMNGILLLSYPCLESFEISNFDKQLYKKKFKSSHDAKGLFNAKRYSLTSINDNTLLYSVINMHRSLIRYGITSYDPSDFYLVNRRIFDIEEDCYNRNEYYNALSLISIMLIDLGIICEV